MSARDSIRAVVAQLAPDAPAAAKREAERALLMAIASIMVQDGYTLTMAADSLGMPTTTLNTWRSRFPAFATALGDAREESRKWLIGTLRKMVDSDSRAAGRAMHILAHLWCPELRRTQIEASVASVPSNGDARAAILATLNKPIPIADDGDE